MQEIKLSKRLMKIVEYIPKDKVIADIGSDHGLIVSYLIYNNISVSAIAGEINDGPFFATKKQVSNYNLEDKISVRKGNGLEVIEENENVEVVIIAGMGGALIVDILDNGKDKLKNVQKLILQPNVCEFEVRVWLDKNRWNIADEKMVKEDNKIYEIIVAEPRESEKDPAYLITDNMEGFPHRKEDLYKIGPILYRKRPEILIEKWSRELRKIEHILKELKKGKINTDTECKKEEFEYKYKWTIEVIKCLQEGNI